MITGNKLHTFGAVHSLARRCNHASRGGSMKILVTGSSGLVGSEAVIHFDKLGHKVIGIDNNMRAKLFGPQGDTVWVRNKLLSETKSFHYLDIDIREHEKIMALFKEERFDVIIHCAAQPSHEKARDIPVTNFEINAVGTLNLLEANRQYSAEAPFVFMSTNKVYGDAPNEIPVKESDTRWDFDAQSYIDGIPESLRIDQSKHSLFGASKVAADIMVQEYGRYFNMPTVCMRGGCFTGPNHSGVETHGFLSYLIRCNLEEKEYTIYGYKGKQVRDNLHSYDVVKFIEEYIKSPLAGEVYNIGGGKKNSISILDSCRLVESITGKPMMIKYCNVHRDGDHICYYSNLSKAQRDFSNWVVTRNLREMFEEIVKNWETSKKQ